MEAIKYIFFLFLLVSCRNSDNNEKNLNIENLENETKIDLTQFPVPSNFEKTSYKGYLNKLGFSVYDKDNKIFYIDSINKNYVIIDSIKLSIDVNSYLKLKFDKDSISLVNQENGFKIYCLKKKFGKINKQNEYILRANKDEFLYIEYLIFYDKNSCVDIKCLINYDNDNLQDEIKNSVYSFIKAYDLK